MSKYVDWARLVISEYVKNNEIIDLEEYKNLDAFKKKAATFVSIHLKDGSLRGCIGTIYPYEENVYLEIRNNAISAAVRDPRFFPIKPSELDSLDISVDLLSDIKKVTDRNMLDPKKYGVIVEKNGRRGLLLPNLDGVDTVEAQIDIAKRKAGIENYSNDDIEISYFSVIRYH